MEQEEIKLYEGKEAIILLNNNFQYTLKVPKNIKNGTFTTKDKYGKLVTITIKDIVNMKEK